MQLLLCNELFIPFKTIKSITTVFRFLLIQEVLSEHQETPFHCEDDMNNTTCCPEML